MRWSYEEGVKSPDGFLELSAAMIQGEFLHDALFCLPARASNKQSCVLPNGAPKDTRCAQTHRNAPNQHMFKRKAAQLCTPRCW